MSQVYQERTPIIFNNKNSMLSKEITLARFLYLDKAIPATASQAVRRMAQEGEGHDDF
jgi:hypothetical protein